MLLGIVFTGILTSQISNAKVVSQINGYMFGDYYYNVKNHKSGSKDENAFQLRRIYFTFENNISKNIKIRFRLESASPKFGEVSKINPFVKQAFLEWNNLIPHHKLYVGIAETNAFKNSESYWGYRSIEKTIMDLNKISSSADLGIALKGDLGKNLHHWLTIFNGTGYGSAEVDRFKKVGYAFWVTPVKGLILEAYGDFENQDPDKPNFEYATDYYGSSGYYTVKGFVGYDAPGYTVGAEAFMRTNKESGTTSMDTGEKADVKRVGYSLFGSWVTPVPKLKLFARYDFFDPNTDDNVIVDEDGTTGLNDEFTQIFAGLDYIPGSNVHIMPNIIYKKYAADGVDADFTARITVFYKFSTGKIIVD